jgi:Peptidase family S41
MNNIMSKAIKKYVKHYIMIILLLVTVNAYSQQKLSLAQQQEDFRIFKTSLKEMHAGLNWFITTERFDALYDSVYASLKENSSTEDFYIKLRLCMASLHHGHGGINLTEKEAGINFRMQMLPKSRKHLPFVLKYLNKRLYILNNCGRNAAITNGSEIISINGEPVSKITRQLMAYIFANGNNETYKYEMLDGYFNFHYFYQVLHPDFTSYELSVIPFKSTKTIKVKVDAVLPQIIADAYSKQTRKDIGKFGELVQYKVLDKTSNTAWLKLESFSKYRVENDSIKFDVLLEKIFTQIKNDGIKNLIVDVRNNEGGDDTWQTAVSYFKGLGENKEAGLSYIQSDKMTQLKYVVRTNENTQLLQAFEYNPYALIDKTPDGRFKLKPEYTQHDSRAWPLQANAYKGKVYLLQNGLTFSAGFAFAGRMRYLFDKDSSFLKVIGEDYGDDLAAGVGSGGWSLDLVLPNSKIKVTIPITGGGTDKPYTMKPVKVLDYRVVPTIEDKVKGVDTEIEFVKQKLIHLK